MVKISYWFLPASDDGLADRRERVPRGATRLTIVDFSFAFIFFRTNPFPPRPAKNARRQGRASGWERVNRNYSIPACFFFASGKLRGREFAIEIRAQKCDFTAILSI